MTSTVFQNLEKAYGEIPQQAAVHLLFSQQPAKTLTYAELIQRAAGYSQALTRANITPGEVVILILEHGEALIEAFFGTVLHGAIPSIMPFLTEKLAPDAYRASLSALFEITRPAAVITYPEFLDEVRQASSPPTILLCDQVSRLDSAGRRTSCCCSTHRARLACRKAWRCPTRQCSTSLNPMRMPSSSTRKM
jgi:acyl-CoA synthetase (AMP-forming)/AMP-acid ligase II